MAADGSQTGFSGRGSRPLDAERVAAIRDALDSTADFAEDARRTLADMVARFRDEICGGDLAHCRELLARAQARLDALPPSALDPRGWFDSPGRRLKAFRRAFDDARREVADFAADLERRHQEAARRNGSLAALWNETRDAVATLDVHVAAAVAWLAEQAPDDERLAGFRRRVEELDALLLIAVRRLPLALGAQNADLVARDHIRKAADALTAWRNDWARALGVEGKKPRKVAPSQAALAGARETLSGVIAAADRELASACARRAEIVSRLEKQAPAG